MNFIKTLSFFSFFLFLIFSFFFSFLLPFLFYLFLLASFLVKPPTAVGLLPSSSFLLSSSSSSFSFYSVFLLFLQLQEAWIFGNGRSRFLSSSSSPSSFLLPLLVFLRFASISRLSKINYGILRIFYYCAAAKT